MFSVEVITDDEADENSVSSTENLETFVLCEKSKESNEKKRNGDHIRNANWILFYTDVNHRVEPVISGTRMVLQFDVFLPLGEMNENEEESEENEEEGDEFEGETPFDYTAPIPPDNLTTLKAKTLSKIVSFLKANLSPTTAITIPLFYLYTSQTIVPERLKDIDRILFDILLSEGFSISIAPITLTCTTDYEGSFSGRDASHRMNLCVFPVRVYEKASPSHMKVYRLPSWPKGVSNIYVYTGMEAIKYLEGDSYCKYTGNEAQLGSNTYLSGGMIIFKTK
jgi:hypothetical protein